MHAVCFINFIKCLDEFSFLAAFTHFQNVASFYFYIYIYIIFFTLHTNQELHTKCKTPHISCKMKHCIQNITSQKQTFAVLLTPARCVCVCCIENCVLFYEIETEVVSGFAVFLLFDWVTSFRNGDEERFSV